MPNAENLKPFSSEHQPPKRGRRKGSRNRSTLLKKWLKVKTDVTDPSTGEMVAGTLEDGVILSLIKQARDGNVRAIEQILDSVYGRLAETQNMNLNFSDLSDEELQILAEGGSIER